MPRSTPIYSAFGIVAIESIWPSSNGDEVPINYLDLSFLRERLFGKDENPAFFDSQESLNQELEADNERLNSLSTRLSSKLINARFENYFYEIENIPSGDTSDSISVDESLLEELQGRGEGFFAKKISPFTQERFSAVNSPPARINYIFEINERVFVSNVDEFLAVQEENSKTLSQINEILDDFDTVLGALTSDSGFVLQVYELENLKIVTKNVLTSTSTPDVFCTTEDISRYNDIIGSLNDSGVKNIKDSNAGRLLFECTRNSIKSIENLVYDFSKESFNSIKEITNNFILSNSLFAVSVSPANEGGEEVVALQGLEIFPKLERPNYELLDRADTEQTISFLTEPAIFSTNDPRALYREILNLKSKNERLLESLKNGDFSVGNLVKNYGTARVSFLGNFVGINDDEDLRAIHAPYVEDLEKEIENINRLINLENGEFKQLEETLNKIEYAQGSILGAKDYGIYPEAKNRPGFSSILQSSEDAFKKRRGYFKILPLNILSISTSSSTVGEVGNSTFSTSFTLDDVIVIADDFASDMIYNSMPRAIPISLSNVESEILSIYNQRLPQEISTELQPYGSTAFRVSGNDFPFNIEDIVEANDTMTIWLYHDPKEFDFVKVTDDIQESVNRNAIREINYRNSEDKGESEDTINSENGFFVSKATHRVISELNETVLEIFLETNIYIKEDDTDLLLSIQNTNNDTLNYLKNVVKENFDKTILRTKNNPLIHPSLCSPEKIEDAWNELVFLRQSGVTSLSNTRAFRIIDRCKTKNSNRTLNIEDIIKNVEFFTITTQTNTGEISDSEVIDFLEPDSSVINESEEISVNDNKPIDLEELVFNKNFSYVVGTASRKSQDDFKLNNEPGEQYAIRPKTRIQSILNDSGILNNYNSPEQLNSYLLNDSLNLITVSPLEAFEFLVSIGDEANLLGTRGRVENEGTFSESNNIILDNILSLMIPNDNNLLKNSVTRNVNLLYLPERQSSNASGESQNEESGQGERDLNLILKRRFSAAFINSIRDTLSNSEDYVAYWNENHANTSVDSNILASVYTPEMVAEFLGFLQDEFVGETSRLASESLEFIALQNVSQIENAAQQNSSNGIFSKRKIFISRSHGETPYLVLKGHIDRVSSKYGAVTGANTVEVEGKGYEKILMENLVYYEDLFSPTGGAFAQAVESYPIYSQMIPPRAMLHFIEMHAPRFLIVGKPSGRYIDAKKMSLYLALNSKSNVTKENDTDEDGVIISQREEESNIWDTYFGEDRVLVRGLATVDINTSGDVTSLGERSNNQPISTNASVRLFYPVNYINTSRIREMINSLTQAYYENIDEAAIRIPFKVTSRSSVANNIVGFNGPKEINHLFIDETGRLRQRLAFEAWERPPQPEYTPTILDTDILASGSSFSRESGPVLTMVDIRANYQGAATGLVDARFAGRTLSPGNDYVPFVTLNTEDGNSNFLNLEKNLFSRNYESISEAFFRYGMRYKLVNDIYTTSTGVARRKSLLYHSFFSKPIKTASISVKGNPSYRIGETVLTCLDSYRYRSREIIDIKKTLEWLKYLQTKPELIKLYIGADKRWVNHDFYYQTTSLDESAEYGYWLNEFKEDPERYVLDRFIEVFKKILDFLPESNPQSDLDLKFITPEYFPTTLWAFLGGREPNFGSDNLSSRSVVNLHQYLYEQLVGKPSGVQFKNNIEKNPNILRAIRMQNFRATSYYIDSIRHAFVHGESFTTSLTLNHGQDNLVLIEPYSMKPIGFMSTERRMRIGYDDVVIGNENYRNENTKERLLWENFNDKKLSDVQRMYIEQFNQDLNFKKSSFLYEAQKTRNSSNFMHELTLENNL